MSLPQRTVRATALEVIKMSDRHYLVRSQRDPDKYYDVFIDGITSYECECPDFEHRDVICKHIRASALAEATDNFKEA